MLIPYLISTFNLFVRYRVIEKRLGETPLQALESFRNSTSSLKGIPLTYAGRLDPMAEGKLLILIDDECKKRSVYDALDKEYEFELLLGYKSDTGDILGLAEGASHTKRYTEREIQSAAKFFLGEHSFPYPAFSSKTVKGIPLFQHALEDTLQGVSIPSAEVRIYSINYIGKRFISKKGLLQEIFQKINFLKVEVSERVGSDFRKPQILERWKEIIEGEEGDCEVLKFRVIASSGTYIRTLAPCIAEKLGTLGLAYSIHRTKIGRYQALLGRFGFWKKVF
ncbi:MAG: hypothetical protein V4437_02585 [Patescibacteria group bacterium]